MATTDHTPAVQPYPPKDSSYVLGADVLLLPEVDGTARLLDLDGDFYTVSAVGAEMLRETLEHGAAAAARRIAGRYGIGAEEVGADLDAFLTDLVKRRLLRRDGRAVKRRGVLAYVALWPALLFVRLCLPAGLARAAALLTLAHVSFRFFGWARTVAVWQAIHRPAQAPASEAEWEGAVRAVDAAVRRAAAGHPLTMECKERALCCWALARWAGLPATLLVGVHLFPLAGHCWCESGPWTLSDGRDRCDTFRPVVQYI